MRSQFVTVGAAVVMVVLGSRSAAQQLPLAPLRASGQTVTPVFEGWYENPDGSFSISFGYYNRNTEEVLEIPIGTNNFIEPGNANQGQPTHFQPRRHWGVFTVRVPADFGNKRVVWTLYVNGQTFSIPGSLKRDWKIDAVSGEGASGNTPPTLRFGADGEPGAGPGGAFGQAMTTSVGTPLTVSVWASDDGPPTSARTGRPNVVTLTWFKHQGPGDVTFGTPTERVEFAGGEMTTTATFGEPGEYVLRVRANDSTVSGAGHAQCCWTNGFVMVTVTQ